MGIQNLSLLIKKCCKNSIETVDLSVFSGSKIAIDTSLYLYKIKYTHNGKIIDGFVKQIMRLIKNGIIPVYIFDGKPPEEKENTLKERKERKLLLNDKIINLQDFLNKLKSGEEILDPLKHQVKDIDENENISVRPCTIEDISEEIEKLNKMNINITSDDIKELKKLLYLMGIPYIDADGEAEVLCARLNSLDYVSGCLSEDTDILANGGKIFIKSFNNTKNIVIKYSLENILNDLSISYEQFVDLCILSGCDYSEKIHGIGIINAYKYILKYKNIENIIENIKNKYDIPEGFNYVKSRDIFFNTFNNIDEYIPLLELKNYNMPGLIEFLKGKLCETTHKLVEKSFIKYRKGLDKNL
jgi:flap endonuclease-1